MAVGSEIRWADLAAFSSGQGGHRTFRFSTPSAIKQLNISPYGDYMAVSTSHTVHIIVLPDSSLLQADDGAPVQVKSFQVGPTAHVREESPVASVLWHPLGYHGRCLVTITREAVVRLWEINRSDRSTFSEPTLSIDLKKLANARNDEEDLSASKFGATKGFSPDSFELEVASACFGDFPEQEGVHGWAPMTLWVAMLDGCIYALCPLLPSRWQLLESTGANTILETLSTSINIAHEATQDGLDASPEGIETAQRQLSWISDITYQEPFEEVTHGESIKVYARPGSVPAVPLLQGPICIGEDTGDSQISDIVVFSLKALSELEDQVAAEGLPTAVMCLLTESSYVHICLDLAGTMGRWLPAATAGYSTPEPLERDLLLIESIALTTDETLSHSHSITPDVHTDFSFFVSHAKGVFYISLESWVRGLEVELAEPHSEGIQFRLSQKLDSAKTQIELCMPRPLGIIPASGSRPDDDEDVTSCVVLEDGNVGYLLLTTFDKEPHAVLLDAPESGLASDEDFAKYISSADVPLQMRPIYQPPKELFEALGSSANLKELIAQRHRASGADEIRLSPANLDSLMKVHKVLSDDTQKLQHAVADLFRRVRRLQTEHRDQIFRTAKVMEQIDKATHNGEDELLAASTARRVEAVKAKMEEQKARHERLRRRMESVSGLELSEKESGYLEELQTMERSVEGKTQALSDDADGSEVPAWERLEKIRGLKEKVTKEAEQACNAAKEERAATRGGVKVPSHSRKQEQEQIEGLLQRESDLVELATSRLRNLGISIASLPTGLAGSS